MPRDYELRPIVDGDFERVRSWAPHARNCRAVGPHRCGNDATHVYSFTTDFLICDEEADNIRRNPGVPTPDEPTPAAPVNRLFDGQGKTVPARLTAYSFLLVAIFFSTITPAGPEFRQAAVVAYALTIGAVLIFLMLVVADYLEEYS